MTHKTSVFNNSYYKTPEKYSVKAFDPEYTVLYGHGKSPIPLEILIIADFPPFLSSNYGINSLVKKTNELTLHLTISFISLTAKSINLSAYAKNIRKLYYTNRNIID